MKVVAAFVVVSAALMWAGCSETREGNPSADLGGPGVDEGPGGEKDVDPGKDGQAGDLPADQPAVPDTPGTPDPGPDSAPPQDLPPPPPDEGPDSNEPPFELVKFVTPVNGANVVESIDVELEAVGYEELKVDKVEVTVNEQVVFRDTKLPTHFVLDTRHYPPGGLYLEAYAELGMLSGTDERLVIPKNAPFAFIEVESQKLEVRDGDLVSIIVTVDGEGVSFAADFSLIDSGYQPGSEWIYPLGGGKYSITYAVSEANIRPDGLYTIPILATFGGLTVFHDHLRLALRNAPPIPISVGGGIYVKGELPQPSPSLSDAPMLSSPNTVIVTGGSTKLSVVYTNAPNWQEIIGVVVGLEGYAGHYQIPLDKSFGTLDVPMLMSTYVDTTDAPPSKLPVTVALRDITGRVSPYATQVFDVQPVGSGDIQVSVSWDTPTDVDLHVVEPTTCELYYGNDTCPSGGWLDLDSNPGCSLDNVNNENIFWPPGQAPAGTYTVRVDFYSDCCDCGAYYTTTIHYCGKVEVYENVFAPNTDDFGGSGSGVHVATFSNEQCLTLIRGRVRFQDRTFDERGFGTWTWKPLRYAVVELKRLSDGQLLATTSTDRAGNYEMQFTNNGPPGLLVSVKAMTDPSDGLRDIAVLDHPKFKSLYQVTSPPIDDSYDKEVYEFDIDIAEELSAGAFNILDVLIDGYDLIRRMTGGELGHLAAFWKTGTDTTETLYCSNYFYDEGTCTELWSLAVQGKDEDRDEYDDMVILKEFFKFALERRSLDDNPGGAHDGTRDDARRAWSEGVSTFFACNVLDMKHFVDSRPHGVYLVDDLDAMPTPFAFRTIGESLLGDVSEYLVSAVLWDLADGLSMEIFDAVHDQQEAIYDVIFNYLPSSDFADRGVPGVDLVDFLDGWFCRGWEQQQAVEGIVDLHREFPYDFAGPLGCTDE